jgi:hypothetical protein
MAFNVRMAAIMSRALDFSPPAIAETGDARFGWESAGGGPAIVFDSDGLASSGGGGVLVSNSGLSSGVGELSGGLPRSESNSVGCRRDAFSRAT